MTSLRISVSKAHLELRLYQLRVLLDLAKTASPFGHLGIIDPSLES
jgi:hypothetical protein